MPTRTINQTIIEHLANRRASLIFVLTLFGSTATLYFSIYSFLLGYTSLGCQLILIPIIGAANIIYLYKCKNEIAAAHILSLLTLILCLILVTSGGVQNTGPLWLYPILAISMFVHSARNAFGHMLLYSASISLALLVPNNPMLIAEYSPFMAHRIIATSSVLAAVFVIIISVHERYQRTIIRMNKQLEELASTDHLTKVHNRNFIYKHFINEQRFTDLVHLESALLILDIDHFKSINDTYGHDIGDIVLKKISDHIAANIRAQDIFARWGGEEFILILNNTPKDTAIARAEHIREVVENMTIEIDTKVIKVTTSIGLAMLAPDKDANKTIKKADKNLYQAKSTGRNKLVTC